MLKRIISGGQTGVDRAALYAGRKIGLEIGGWCPKGRRAEDMAIPESFILQETESSDYKERTELNVTDSHATLIIKQGWITPGTRYTIKMAQKHSRPCRVIDLADGCLPKQISEWLNQNRVETLNVAGPRESSLPGIQLRAEKILLEILSEHTGKSV